MGRGDWPQKVKTLGNDCVDRHDPRGNSDGPIDSPVDSAVVNHIALDIEAVPTTVGDSVSVLGESLSSSSQLEADDIPSLETDLSPRSFIRLGELAQRQVRRGGLAKKRLARRGRSAGKRQVHRGRSAASKLRTKQFIRSSK